MSAMVGVSTALTVAARAEGEGTWYVREDGVTSHAVDKRGKTIFVLRMGGGS